MPNATHLPSLFSLFRQYGYDGATLSKISKATGLGKASLYHHFPGGKNDMAAAVLNESKAWLTENVVPCLTATGSPEARLQAMCDRIHALYDGGAQPCLLAILQAGTGREVFHEQIKAMVTIWIAAIASVLREAGQNEATADQRAQTALVSIQGALMISQALDDMTIFQRTIRQLPVVLLRE